MMSLVFNKESRLLGRGMGIFVFFVVLTTIIYLKG